MLELLLVLGLTGGLVGGAALMSRTPWEWLFGGGLMLVVLGLLVGVPTGLWYHLRLRGVLHARGALPRGWWLQPHRLHEQLSEAERLRVLAPFYAGAAGFVISMLGCFLLAVGAFRAPPG